METRKLQMVGGGTYTVSIPKEWATNQSLEAGTPVHLYRHRDGSIVVRSARKEGERLDAARVAVDTDSPAVVGRTIRAAHAAGFETIRLVRESGFTDAQRRAAREAARGLVGADASVAAAELVVRTMLDASDVSVRQSVDQLRFLACSLHRDALAAFLEADGGAGDRLADRAAEARRLSGMVTRHCNRALVSFEEVDRLGTSRPELFDARVAARQLERVARQGRRVATLAARVGDPPDDDTATALGDAGEAALGVVDDAVAALLHDADAAAAHAALDRRDATVDRLDAVEATLFETRSVAAAGVVDALRATARAGGGVAEAAVGASLRDDRL
ncbi:AbrB/MazE/SpoVT family DNA-binding domain-containing protein [Halorarius halobius]|uniref:AbrB/MazE/SpoVT family DNA-binding domain-containing protein n=1 Tax=Halorarius halobius TaxID=2962671 RepID=UPI0020CF2160|nr:AbrB/MazE/SpoVT family DNA-binding domain-containing protein [Halorarius halobius]